MECGGLIIGSRQANIYAEKMYEQIRKRRTDCVNVARNSGLNLEQVTIIKNYLFKDCHELSYGYKPFHPSYEIAESWRRLSEKSGRNIQKHDILLLYHELTEICILLSGKYSQLEAHNLASLRYDYQLESDNYYMSLGQI